MKKIHPYFTTVTLFSKLLAAILFVLFPFIGFFLGMRYQEILNLADRQQMEQNLTIKRIPTTTLEESANWKTYRNDQYGFSFQYPQYANYRIDPNPRKGIQLWLEVPKNFTVYFTAVPNDGNLSLSHPESLFNNGPFTTEFGSARVNKIILGGYEAYRADNCCVNRELNFWATTEIITVKNNNIYEIRVEPVGSAEKNKQYSQVVDRKLMDQILSTFKFTQ